MTENNNSSYKNLIVWQKSLIFANEVINLTEKMETDRKHYRLVEQLEAAATSVPMMRRRQGEIFSKRIQPLSHDFTRFII